MRLFFLSLIMSVSIYSQSSGKITYSFYIPLSVDDAKDENTKMFVSKMIEFANKQEFELSFNKTKSSFIYIDKLNYDSEYDRKVNNIAKFYTSSDIYTNFVNKIDIAVMKDGTLIKGTVEVEKWDIQNESKKIGNYLCYKAISQKTFVNRIGEQKTREIICWFAPALPYSYGPKTFNGLPGLILELTEDNKTFVASKIEFFDKEIEINFPKGKMVSKEEYDKKLKEGLGAIIKPKS